MRLINIKLKNHKMLNFTAWTKWKWKWNKENANTKIWLCYSRAYCRAPYIWQQAGASKSHLIAAYARGMWVVREGHGRGERGAWWNAKRFRFLWPYDVHVTQLVALSFHQCDKHRPMPRPPRAQVTKYTSYGSHVAAIIWILIEFSFRAGGRSKLDKHKLRLIDRSGCIHAKRSLW